jgi:hypothetical protein
MRARYVFDRWGNCLGFVDAKGRYVDGAGHYKGDVDGAGSVRGRDGRCCGRIDVQGQLWSENGTAIGYLGPEVALDPRRTYV